MTESTRKEIDDGVYYEFRPTNEALNVSVFRPTPDGTDDEVFYSADLARDFYKNQQKRYEKIELEAEHWNDLVDYWSDRKEIAEREELTQREQAAEDVLRRLRSSKLKVYDERERIEAPESTWNAFYDDENEVEDAKVPDEKTVVWVRSDTVREILDDKGHGSGYVGELSHVLREKGAMLTKSRKKGLVTRVYPFEPEAVGITDPELQVIYPDDDGGVEI